MAMKFMNSDSLFSRVFERIFDLIMLNILWAIGCIPVITAGASTTALYYMTMKMARKENYAVIKDFIRAFRQNFVKATMLWVFILIPGATLAMGYYYIYTQELMSSMGALMLVICCTVLYLLLITYLFPLQARFENTVAGTIINSFIMGVRYFPKTFVIWLCWLVPLVCSLWSLAYMAAMSFLWILFGVAAIAWITSMLYMNVFNTELARQEQPETGEGVENEDDSAELDSWDDEENKNHEESRADEENKSTDVE